MSRTARHRLGAFALVELVIAIVLIVVLLGLFVPALYTARNVSHREQCAANLVRIGEAMHAYLDDNNDQFPTVASQPAWRYGGLRFSSADGQPFLDPSRPLNRWVSPYTLDGRASSTFCCPGDDGIYGDLLEIGTGRRSACRSFGTSYRANACLFDARLVGKDTIPRGMYLSEVTTAPSRMLVLGDAVWYEVAESTDRRANWHVAPGKGNILFLDNSLHFQAVRPRGQTGPVMLDPSPAGSVRIEPRGD